MESQQEPPAGGGPKGPITEEDIRNAISDREIIDVTTPSDGEEAETEARTTLTAKKHTENKEQEVEVEAMSDTSEPPRFDEATAESLSFTDMYEYVRGEIKGMTLDQAQDVESVVAFIQDMFADVFLARPAEPLAPNRNHYPELEEEETRRMLQLFLTDIQEETANARKWRARMLDLTRIIYKSRKSLKETLEFTEQAARRQQTRGSKTRTTLRENPWLEKLVLPSEKNTEDDEMNGRAKFSTFRFLRSSYQPNEIEQLKKLCEDRYGFQDALRQPTEAEWKNTFRAQVEGDLMFMLSPQFKVYPAFNRENDSQMSSSWASIIAQMTLRRTRQFPLKNAHEEEEPLPQDNTQRATQLWVRQIGLDGIRNEQP
ncbi:hypothetical protein GN244_ATG02668 [Phytophthora infestans]|uniref:Uncharacterized protein n=1 Tax=Phytophthora infestans TaxID=4787 RepID=A0A833WLT1_PHYIN|nr:hypothetical protein GN244_ATG02668 [Phytophthora infestans]KAF4138901.1 hypothetical protein GN958_ATG11858 [Phytophthora infestans]